MAFPATALGDVRIGELASATPGSLVSFPLEHKVLAAVVLGEPGAAATHLLADVEGMPSILPMANLRNVPVLHVEPKERLILEIGDDEASAHHLPNYLGCLALTNEGMVVQASIGASTFHRHASARACLTTFRFLANTNDFFPNTTWFTNWSLSVRDVNKRLIRIVGNPVWPDAVRLQR